MKTQTAAQEYNKRLHAMFDTARDQEKQDKALPFEYAAGSIGNARRGVVAMMRRGAWGYDDETGQLMAAAPELLAALRELMTGHSMAGQAMAEKAIALATGEKVGK